MEKPPTPVSKATTPTLAGAPGGSKPPHLANPSPFALGRNPADPFNAAASQYARPNMVRAALITYYYFIESYVFKRGTTLSVMK